MIICEVNRIDNRKMIYLDDAIDAVEKESQIDGAYGYMDTKSIVDLLNDLSSAQPKIVRCKDCKWKQGSECVRFAEVRPFPDDFCSRAERRKQ